MNQTENPDWFLREWMAHFGKKQAALVNELGWDKARASFVWNSKQGYKRDLVNEIARWLDIRPHELLMPPDEALLVRRFRETARRLADEIPGSPPPTAVHNRKLGA